MSTRRNLRIDLLALAFLGSAGMLALALATYDPADDLSGGAHAATVFRRDVAVWPANEAIVNRCGYWGALVADVLFGTLGWTALLSPLLLAVPGVLILRRMPPELPWLRFVGVFGVVVAGCSILEQVGLLPGPGPVAGAGGRLGVVMTAMFAGHLGHVGGFLAAGGLLITGVVLALDQSVLTALRIAAFGARGVGKVGGHAIRTMPRGLLLRNFAEGRLAEGADRRSVWADLFDEEAAGPPAVEADDDEQPAPPPGWLASLSRALGLSGGPTTRIDESDGRLRGPLRMQSDLVAPKRPARPPDFPSGGDRPSSDRLTVDRLAERHAAERPSSARPMGDRRGAERPASGDGTPTRATLLAAGGRSGPVGTRRDDQHAAGLRPPTGRTLPEPDDEDDEETPSDRRPGRGWSDLERIPADLSSGDDEAADAEDEAPPAPAEPARPARREAPPVEAAAALREAVREELNEADTALPARSYALPSVNLLKPADTIHFADQETEVREKAATLERTFGQFGFQVKVVAVETGPVIAQYELKLQEGLRLSKITGLAEDLAIALCVPSVCIVAPLPGRNTVGVEVPNSIRRFVRLREVFEESKADAKKMHIPIFLGKGVAGDPIVLDLAKMPHLLIAGATGTGKSVCLNTIIASILMSRRPDEVRMLLLDPKKVELSPYGTLPHLMHPVVTDPAEKAEPILAWAVDKMEERYTLLAKAGVRHLSAYNQLGEEELMRRLRPADEDEAAAIPRHLPFIVMVLDEYGDIMQAADKGKGREIESHIIRLAQKSRAVGIHLILATQRPTVEVITGLIKSNLPSRISFKVSQRNDSRVILDEQGAEKLLGDGDLLYITPGKNGSIRGQGTYLDDEEIQKLIKFVSQTEPQFVEELMNLRGEGDTTANGDGKPITLKKRDDLYEAAVEVVVAEGRGSVSLLQRNLGIGYGRAARLIDYMAEDGIVGTYNGQNARQVMLTPEQWKAMKGDDGPPPEPVQPLRIKIGPHHAYHDGGQRPEPSGRFRAEADDEDAEPVAVRASRMTFEDDDSGDDADNDNEEDDR